MTLCTSDNPISLFDQLSGTPDLLGTWSPQLASGGNIFNPLLDGSGTYVYTVSNANCGASSATMNVIVNTTSNAGIGANITICEDAALFDLNSILIGEDAGGVWSPSLASGTSIFNPQIDPQGVYTYSLINANCGDVSSEVEVVIENLSNAGVDTTLEICANETPFSLVDRLNGNPDTNGYWTPSLASGNNTFDPLVDQAGQYTYTVPNAICGDETAIVDISIIPGIPIVDYSINIIELSENNTIEIIITTGLTYEYSLNGTTFQDSPLFTNLQGGMYTVYVREINGCGILEAEVCIIDYMKFFTPNSDGYNDSWQLRGIKEQEYSVVIFDRYGKTIAALHKNNPAWDGLYRGRKLPSSDYWFLIELKNGIRKMGHFSLIR